MAGGQVKLRPELMMAACRGEPEKLYELLRIQDASPSSVAVHIDDEEGAAPPRRPTTATAAAAAAAPAVGLGSILHVVASSGDGDNFLRSADVICAMDARLLYALNSMGDTPLQCAVRAGNITMVSRLIDLTIRESGGDDARLKAMLQNQNGERKTGDSSHAPVPGDTALHDALRLTNKNILNETVHKLLQYNVELARIDRTDGISPLYLAVMLGHYDIAETLYQKNKKLSYSGPGGQNVLHVAVLRSHDMINKLLKWNKDLTKQGDNGGSTPLHLAATWGNKYRGSVRLLLDRDESSAFQADDNGSFPVHAAAAAAVAVRSSVVSIFLERHPSCAGLQDAAGRTFLHIAVKEERIRVVRYACWGERPGMAAVLNIQDNAGNTALHLAAEVGNQWSFYYLIQNPHVQLNLVNNKGQTPLDIAWEHRPQGKIIYGLHPRVRIHQLLGEAGAKTRTYKKYVRRNVDEKLDKMITDSTQVIGVGSVLIVTVTMAAATAIPGGFRDDQDKHYKGTAALADQTVFQLFIIANTLAFVCSALATVNVMIAGLAPVDIGTRRASFLCSIGFLYCSAKALVASFLFGLCAVLPPTAMKIAHTASAITTPLLVLDVLWLIVVIVSGEVMLIRRFGWIIWLRNSVARIRNFILDIIDIDREQ